MGIPVFIDEAALASNPFDVTQTYTDLTARARLRSWSRGRQKETDHPDTGRSSLTFENLDRALDPENTASAYYPDVLPMRRTRCRATLDGSTYYTMFTTFVDPEQGWQIVQTDAGYAEVVAAANDGFDLLSTSQFNATDTFSEQTPDDRISAILDRFNWPTAERDIDTASGQTMLAAASAGDLTGQSALDQIQAATDTEDGIFYIDGRGYAVYHSRYWNLLNDRATVSQATFSDMPSLVGGAYLYQSLAPLSSKIINQYLVTAKGGLQQIAEDIPSQDLYGLRSQTLNTLHTTDAQALAYGNYLLAKTKDPHRRYDQMVLTPGADSDLWLLVLTLGIGDRITVMYTPPGGGDPDTRDMHIEALNVTVGPATSASVTYRLSPAAQVIGWVADDPINGLAAVSTFAVY